MTSFKSCFESCSVFEDAATDCCHSVVVDFFDTMNRRQPPIVADYYENNNNHNDDDSGCFSYTGDATAAEAALASAGQKQQQQYLIRFEMIHRTFVVPPPYQHQLEQQQHLSSSLALLPFLPIRGNQNDLIKDKDPQEQEQTTIDIINYIKRNIILQIHQLHLTNSIDPILRTLQRHLRSINDLIITQLHFPFGNVSLQQHLHHIIGGKGGFGTLLKGQSKQSSVTTTKNFTSCRNLQGQRLQQVNDQIHLKLVMEWKEKIQNGIATEYDMIQALTNTSSGIPGWHLPLPSWSEVSIKKEMKQNQKLLHRYKREQQQKQKMKSDIKQQQEEQLHYYIDTTNHWTEKMERTVTSALQQSIQKQRKQQQQQKLIRQHQQEEEDDKDERSHSHKRQKIENESRLVPVTNNDQSVTNDEIDILYRQKQISFLPPIVTISGNATIALLPSSLSLSSSSNDHDPNHATNTTTDNESNNEKVYWNIQSDSNFCTIGVLLDYHTIERQASICLYYEVVIVSGSGVIQIGWAATTTTTAATNTDNSTKKNEHEDQPTLPQLFQPNSDNGDGVGDCQYSWGYDPTRNIKLHNCTIESYVGHDAKLDTNSPSSPMQPGDVIGCTYNLSNGEMRYSYNGNELDVAYQTSSNTAMHLIPAISLNEDEQIELRLQLHEMKYLPKIATAAGEVLLKQKSSSPELVDSDNTGNTNSRNHSEEKNGNVDDHERKLPAIDMTEGITSVAHVLPSSGSSLQVLESKDKDTENAVVSDVPIDLHQYNSASELEVFGLQLLKAELMKRGLKCGGTLQERAKRLYAIRDIINPNDYPTKLLAPTKT